MAVAEVVDSIIPDIADEASEDLVEEVVASTEVQKTPADELAKEVAKALKEWQEVFPDNKADIARIIKNLENRDEQIDPRGGYPSLRDKEVYEEIGARGKEQLLFQEGYWDDVKTELRVLSGLLQEQPTREAAFAVFMYADCLTNPAAYQDKDAFINSARGFKLSTERFPDEKIESLFESIQVIANNRTESFANYVDNLERRKAELGTTSDFEGMRAQYHSKREILVAFIEEVDELIPWEPNEAPWQHLEEVPGGWSEDWLEKLAKSGSEISNPYNVRVEVDGKFIFLPYTKSKLANFNHRLVNKDVRIQLPDGTIKNEEVGFVEEYVTLPQHRSALMGTALGVAVPGGRDRILTVRQVNQCFNATSIIDTTERRYQYEASKRITPKMVDQLRQQGAPRELLEQLEWCLDNPSQFYLRPQIEDGKWTAVVVGGSKHKEVIDMLRQSEKALNKLGFTYEAAIAESRQESQEDVRKKRIKQRIETYIPRQETMFEVERAGLYVGHEIDKVLEHLKATSPERNAHLIAQIEEAKFYLDGQYSEFNFIYGKESYYKHLAIERVMERARLGLIDLTEADMVSGNPKWEAYINAEVQKIHVEFAYKAMALKNVASEIKRLGIDVENMEEFDLLRYANVDLIVDRDWRRKLFENYYNVSNDETRERLDRVHSTALRGRYEWSGHVPVTFAGAKRALDLSTQRMTFWEIQKILYLTPERENMDIPEVWLQHAERIIESLRQTTSHPDKIPPMNAHGYLVMKRRLAEERYLRSQTRDFSQAFPPPVETDSIPLAEALEGYFSGPVRVEFGVTPAENINWYAVAETLLPAEAVVETNQTFINALADELQKEYRAGIISPQVRSVLETMPVGSSRPGSWVLDGNIFIQIVDDSKRPATTDSVASIAPGSISTAALPSGESLTGFEGSLETQAEGVLTVLEVSLNGSTPSNGMFAPAAIFRNMSRDEILQKIASDLKASSVENPPKHIWWTAYNHYKETLER